MLGKQSWRTTLRTLLAAVGVAMVLVIIRAYYFGRFTDDMVHGQTARNSPGLIFGLDMALVAVLVVQIIATLIAYVKCPSEDA